MRVLLVSKFLHHVGGVETYLRWQAQQLRAEGHDVALLGMRPPEGEPMMDFGGARVWQTPTRSFTAGLRDRLPSAAASVWSRSVGHVMREALTAHSPDIVHFHGTCYQLTPAVVHEAVRAQIPTVLTAHEYKLACTNQKLYDEAARSVCTDCVGVSAAVKISAPVRRSCVKGSRSASLVGAIESQVSGPVWRRANPLILAPSQFMRDLLISDGWPVGRTHYLDLSWRRDDEDVRHAQARESVVFLGRLSAEKGALSLLRMWEVLAELHPGRRLRIIGDGVERPTLERECRVRGIPRVDFLGRLDHQAIDAELADAAVTVHPAQWHENSPFTVRESLMAGVPAVVSSLGGMQDMVSGITGRVVPHDDIHAWVHAVDDLLSSPPDPAAFAEAVRARSMTDGQHLTRLMEFYRSEVGGC